MAQKGTPQRGTNPHAAEFTWRPVVPLQVSMPEAYAKFNKLDDLYEKFLYSLQQTNELERKILREYDSPELEEKGISIFRDLFHVQIFGGFAIYKWLDKMKRQDPEIMQLFEKFMTSPYITTDDIDFKIFADDSALKPGSLNHSIVKYYANDIYEFIKNMVDTIVPEDYKPLADRYKNNKFGNYYKFIKKGDVDIVYMVKKKIPGLEIYEKYFSHSAPGVILEYPYLTNTSKNVYKFKPKAPNALANKTKTTMVSANTGFNNLNITVNSTTPPEKEFMHKEPVMPMIAPLNLTWANMTHMFWLGLIALVLNRKSNRVIGIIKLLGRIIIVNKLVSPQLKLYKYLMDLLISVEKLNSKRGEFNYKLTKYVKTHNKELGDEISAIIIDLFKSLLPALVITNEQAVLVNMIINDEAEFKRDISPSSQELEMLNSIFPRVIAHPSSARYYETTNNPELAGGVVITGRRIRNMVGGNTATTAKNTVQTNLGTNSTKKVLNTTAMKRNEIVSQTVLGTSSELNKYMVDNPTPADMAFDMVIRAHGPTILKLIKAHMETLNKTKK